MNEDKKPEEIPEKCMDLFKHAFQWIWENGKWTNKLRCTTCGVIKLQGKRFEGQ